MINSRQGHSNDFSRNGSDLQGPNRKECVVKHLQLGFARITEQGRRESLYRNADPDSTPGHNNRRSYVVVRHFDSKLRKFPIGPDVCRLTFLGRDHDCVLVADQTT